MKKYILIALLSIPSLVTAQQTMSLEECYGLANKNYPIAKQIGLLKNKANLEIDIIATAKLPKLDLNAQATYQSDVIKFPFQLPNATIKPLNKDQYKATLDINQLIYNGGNLGAQIKLLSAALETQQQQVIVNLYQLKSEINQLYFSMLLLQEQEDLLYAKQKQLQLRISEVKTGVKFGAILPSSESILESEILKINQQLIQAQFDKKELRESLASLIATKINEDVILVKPALSNMSMYSGSRPELKLFELKKEQIEWSKRLISKSTLPKIYGFAQAGYGNPGLNMLNNSFQDFYILGVKASWNIFDWGKAKTNRGALTVTQEIINSEKETFQLNNEIKLQEAENEIHKMEELVKSDRDIIALGEKILISTDAQLRNGVITSSQYLIEFNNLYGAKINQKMHEIQLELAKANYKVINGSND